MYTTGDQGGDDAYREGLIAHRRLKRTSSSSNLIGGCDAQSLRRVCSTQQTGYMVHRGAILEHEYRFTSAPTADRGGSKTNAHARMHYAVTPGVLKPDLLYMQRVV